MKQEVPLKVKEKDIKIILFRYTHYSDGLTGDTDNNAKSPYDFKYMIST